MLRNYRAQAGAANLDPEAAIMASIAGKLTDAEIEALASYVNGLH